MRIDVVSDIHGNFDDLARVSDAADILIVLGDLLDYVDYTDPGSGILGTIFGADAVSTLIGLRTAGRFHAFHEYDRSLWSRLADPAGTLNEVVAEQYVRAISALGENTFLTLGNVDVEHVWSALAPSHLRHLDGESILLDGVRFGFVAGGAVREPPVGSPWRSFDRDYETYRSALAAVGDSIDVLCSHVPPDIEDLRFDTVAGRAEMYGPGLVELIDDQQPALALFGHIHHPRAKRVVRGGTQCVNVGYFKRQPHGYLLETDEIRATR